MPEKHLSHSFVTFFCIFNMNANSSESKADTLTKLTSRLFV